jgi:DNA-binding transcriptional regulator LsrR (DeoR family)
MVDDALVAVAGGRQVWSVVQHLSPRRLKLTIAALGMHQADPKLLHAHPNTIATMLWLLYSPRTQANVIGSYSTSELWKSAQRNPPSMYFVLSSCSSLDDNSSFADLLGAEITRALRVKNVLGDYAYAFFDRQGKEIEVALKEPHSTLSFSILQNLSEQANARTMLVAGGPEKLPAMRAALKAKLCNTVISDEESARGLLA